MSSPFPAKAAKNPSKHLIQASLRGYSGAGNVTRTHDLLITNQLLYRLSYTSAPFSKWEYITAEWFRQPKSLIRPKARSLGVKTRPAALLRGS